MNEVVQFGTRSGEDGNVIFQMLANRSVVGTKALIEVLLPITCVCAAVCDTYITNTYKYPFFDMFLILKPPLTLRNTVKIYSGSNC